MIVYLGLDIVVLFLASMFSISKIKFGKNELKKREYLYIIVGLILIFISSFRGNFSRDYDGYVDIFNRFKDFSFEQIWFRSWFSYPEKGYLIFQYVINKVFHDSLFLFIISSIIIVSFNLYIIKQYADDDLFAIFLFLEAGVYYSSFNLMRQVLAASIVIMGSKFLYERKLVPYLAVVFLASTIHISALIMIPFYFISNIKFGKKIVWVFPIALSGTLIVLPRLVLLIQKYYWSWYYKDASSAVGYSWKNVLIPIAISLFAFINYLINRKELDRDDEKTMQINNIWLNATFFYALFYLLGLQLKMAQRFSFFFSTYTLCFFCNQTSRSRYRNVIILISVLLLIIFGYVTKDEFPYYFIWNN